MAKNDSARPHLTVVKSKQEFLSC